jgi:archaellum component FlaC
MHLDKQIQEMKDEISQLRNEIKGLRKDIQILTNTCGRMDTHISFVDSVYENIRYPIQTIGRRLFGGFNMPEQNHILQIENRDDQNN